MKSSLEQEFARICQRETSPGLRAGMYVFKPKKSALQSSSDYRSAMLRKAHLFSFLTRIRRKAAMWNIHGRL